VVNSVSPGFVKRLLQKNIPLISATEEYFPFCGESVISDADSAVQKTFKHLYALGQRRIAMAAS